MSPCSLAIVCALVAFCGGSHVDFKVHTKGKRVPCLFSQNHNSYLYHYEKIGFVSAKILKQMIISISLNVDVSRISSVSLPFHVESCSSSSSTEL